MAHMRFDVNRRTFVTRTALAAGITTVGGGMFDALVARANNENRNARDDKSNDGVGYGPLRPAGDDLALPPGFQYRVVSTEGDPMADGFPAPKAMDGMGAFPLPNGNVLLVRNCEDNEDPNRLRPRPAGSTSTSAGILNDILETHYGPRASAYDEFAGGGTTTLEVETHGQRELVSQHWSLVGTLRNCAGGVTPWGSWLSCEETLLGGSPTATTGFAQNHGYCFEVPIDTPPGAPADPVALKHLGRFAHEAVAVDPATGIVYETEDSGDGSGFYRYVPAARPTRPGDLAVPNGVLQMLKIRNAPQYETAINQTIGLALPVEWVTITTPDPATPTGAGGLSTVFLEGLNAGGTRFRRLEGCWYGNGRIFFVSTNGGNMGFGQTWVYDPTASTLTMIFESPGVDVCDGPDNCCVTPRGGLVMCEDAGGAQFLRALTPKGEIFDLARNLRNTIEFAGVCFSPDGGTLFVNQYGRSTVRTTQPYRAEKLIPVGPERFERAATLAIWGPWRSGPL